MDIFSILLPAGVVMTFYLYFGSKRLNPIEKGLTPLFQEQCGGKINGIYFTGLIRHAIYEKFLILAYGRTQHIVKFDEVESIELKEGLLSTKLIVHWKSKESKGKLSIQSLYPYDVVKILLKLNVRVVQAK